MKYVLLTFIFFFITNLDTLGQEKKDSSSKWHSNNIIKFNTIGLIDKYLSFSYERVITDKFSAQVSYGNGKTKTISDKENNQIYGSYSIEHFKVISTLSFELRYYLSNKHTHIPGGFHIGPSINFLNISHESIRYIYPDTEIGRDNGNYKITSVNLNLGPQILIRKIITIDFMIAPGIGFLTAKDTNKSKTDTYYGKGFSILYGIYIGIALGK